MTEVQEVKPSRHLVVTAACVSNFDAPMRLVIHNFKPKYNPRVVFCYCTSVLAISALGTKHLRAIFNK